MKRYESMKEAQGKWGMCGLMESHHYGFYPSFISKLSKWCFWEREENFENILKIVLKGTFGEADYENVDKALKDNNLKSKIILQIHDELILDCPLEEITTVAKLLKDNMQNVVKLSVPLTVEVSSGKTLFDCK